MLLLRFLDLPLLLLLSWSLPIFALDDPFNCKFEIGSFKYDLTSLDGEKKIEGIERPMPPTTEVDTVRISLCSDLKTQEGVPPTDQCPSGTRVCMTKTNRKDGQDRIVSVIPIAQTSALNPSYSALSSPKGVSLLLHGASYPHPTGAQQSVNISVLCDPGTTSSEPKFKSYNGELLEIEWSASAGCFMGDDDKHENEPENPGKETPSSGSGLSSMGWFLLLLIIAFVAYMGLGAYYNYSTYGASGIDLIPHRDFWMEVPYMLRDVLSHLCSAVRPRRSHRGYAAMV